MLALVKYGSIYKKYGPPFCFKMANGAAEFNGVFNVHIGSVT